MGTAYGSASTELMAGPFAGSVRRYNLFQAIDLSCKWLSQVNQIDEEQAYGLIAFAGNSSLAFPKSEIEEVFFIWNRVSFGRNLSLTVSTCLEPVHLYLRIITNRLLTMMNKGVSSVILSICLISAYRR